MRRQFMFNKKGAIFQGVAFGFLLTSILASAVTLSNPSIKRDFREKKAVSEFGITQATAEALSDEALLDLIRDDAPGVPSRANLMKANPNMYLGG